jgi:type II secretory pathway component GspD/PulD (secretin)
MAGVRRPILWDEGIMKRTWVAGLLCLIAVGAGGASREDWARLMMDKGLKPGRSLSIEEWNHLINRISSDMSTVAPSTATVESLWTEAGRRFGFPPRDVYTDAEWAALAKAVTTGSAAPPAVAAPAPVTPSTSTAIPTLSTATPATTAEPTASTPTIRSTETAAAPVLAPPPAPAAPAEERPKLKKRISLDVREMDLIEVLKTLSRQTGLNIVVGKNVSGRVTVFLNDVDFWDALRTILESRDMAYIQERDMIQVVTEQDYERLFGARFGDRTEVRVLTFKNAKASTVKALLEPIKSKVGELTVNEVSNSLTLQDAPETVRTLAKMAESFDVPVVTKVFTLNHGQVDDVLPKLTGSVSKDFGNIQADKRSNSIVVTDNPARVAEIESLVKSFDVPNRAVLIEAKIVMVLLNDEFQWGVNWQTIFNRVAGNSLKSPINANLAGNFLNVPLETVTPSASGAVAAKGVTGNVTISQLPHQGTVSSVINFLSTMGKTNMLSAPRITAMNNQEANIHVGTKEAIITRNIINPGSTTTQPIVTEDVKFESVGVKLSVTPFIGADGYMTLKVKPEVSAVESTITTTNGSVIPVVRVSEADTSVVVKDGVTLVIGGLIEDKKIKQKTHVPFLGRIPLLGLPFRSQKDVVQKTELVIFLTPHVTTGDVVSPETDVYLPPFREVLERKPRRGFFARLFGRRPKADKR